MVVVVMVIAMVAAVARVAGQDARIGGGHEKEEGRGGLKWEREETMSKWQGISVDHCCEVC